MLTHTHTHTRTSRCKEESSHIGAWQRDAVQIEDPLLPKRQCGQRKSQLQTNIWSGLLRGEPAFVVCTSGQVCGWSSSSHGVVFAGARRARWRCGAEDVGADEGAGMSVVGPAVY